MADSVVDIVLTGTTWQDAYTLSSIAVGTTVVIQNKTSGFVSLFIKATIPLVDTSAGYSLASGEAITMPASLTGIWLFGDGPVHIRSLA